MSFASKRVMERGQDVRAPLRQSYSVGCRDNAAPRILGIRLGASFFSSIAGVWLLPSAKSSVLRPD